LTHLNLGCNRLGVSGGEALAAFFHQAAASVSDPDFTAAVAATHATTTSG